MPSAVLRDSLRTGSADRAAEPVSRFLGGTVLQRIGELFPPAGGDAAASSSESIPTEPSTRTGNASLLNDFKRLNKGAVAKELKKIQARAREMIW
jgi:hypothetical protein